MRKIKKVKWNQKEKFIQIDYHVNRGGPDNDEYSIKFRDEARPEFYAAMIAMSKHWSEILELDHDEDTQVTNVSFSWAQDVMGVTIYGSRRLKESTGLLGCNTPHRIEDFYSEEGGGDEGQVMSAELVQDCKVLLSEADLYIDGERAQMNLFKQKEAA